MTSAECMRRLRKKRKLEGKCTRCGRLLIDGKCEACYQYRQKYNEKVKAIRQANYISVCRKLKTWKVVNHTLHNLMKEHRISTAELGKAVGANERSVQRWLYQGSIPKDETKEKLNEYFKQEVFELTGKHK